MFERNLRVTIQQIGAAMIPPGRDELRDAIDASDVIAGNGWTRLGHGPVEWVALCERVDDYCATAYVMCRHVQPVPPVDVDTAIADVGRFAYESPSALEQVLAHPTSPRPPGRPRERRLRRMDSLCEWARASGAVPGWLRPTRPCLVQ